MPRKPKPAAQAAAASTTATGVQYWLLKTEPGEWSWSDQAGAQGGVAPWDGVRNHQAMNNLRAMRAGDWCLFYHSGAGAASRRVVGVVEVARTWYEAEGKGDGKEAAAGGAVDVRAVGEFRNHVSLREIKKAAGEVEGMRDFALLRQPRLSVMPVPAKVWDWIYDAGGASSRTAKLGKKRFDAAIVKDDTATVRRHFVESFWLATHLNTPFFRRGMIGTKVIQFIFLQCLPSVGTKSAIQGVVTR